jgi:hypothetical protein
MIDVNALASSSTLTKGQRNEVQVPVQGDVTYATAHSFSTDDDTPTKPPPQKVAVKKVAPGASLAAKKAAAEKKRKRDVCVCN